tara:strand:- start:5757 stop:6314 length:558 start_codon:yes stop_codon:yes gene_type:complete
MYYLKQSHSIWLTGLPSSGKTTISKKLLNILNKYFPLIILDSDECNKFFYKKKNYSLVERKKSTLNFIKLTKILLRSKCIIIISANHACNFQRNLARKKIKKKYKEIWIHSSISKCKRRDVKKLFYKAKKGIVKNLIGYDLKFDKPLRYNLKVNTENNSLDICSKMIIKFLLKKKIIYASKNKSK